MKRKILYSATTMLIVLGYVLTSFNLNAEDTLSKKKNLRLNVQSHTKSIINGLVLEHMRLALTLRHAPHHKNNLIFKQ
jgi:hypothetical protein